MRKTLVLLILLVATVPSGFTQTAAASAAEKVVTFRFVAGDDMFYIPWAGNGQQLDTLHALVDTYRAEITSGAMPVYVDGYCTSSENRADNLRTAAVRSNRVKSELITRKGLTEANFVTKNHAAAYTVPDGASYRDMVVVTLRIPAKAEAEGEAAARAARERERAEAARLAAERAERDRMAAEQAARERAEAERLAAEQAQRERMAAEEAARLAQAEPQPASPEKPYCVAVRTNLLYDAMLLPTLGVEWRVNQSIGIKVDGSRSWWEGEHGKVQKIWLVNPELRWYLLDSKRFYVGASANFGEYNLYGYPLGKLFSKDTGYQGSVWSAGLTVGYQLCLSRHFSVDFNLGLGYTRSEYDSYGMTNGVRVYKAKDQSKNFWGPTQAGISLVWTIGSNQ